MIMSIVAIEWLNPLLQILVRLSTCKRNSWTDNAALQVQQNYGEKFSTK